MFQIGSQTLRYSWKTTLHLFIYLTNSHLVLLCDRYWARLWGLRGELVEVCTLQLSQSSGINRAQTHFPYGNWISSLSLPPSWFLLGSHHRYNKCDLLDPLIQYLLSTYYVLGTVLGARDTTVDHPALTCLFHSTTTPVRLKWSD